MKIKNPYIHDGKAIGKRINSYLLTDNYGMIHTLPGGVLSPIFFEYSQVDQVALYLDRMYGEDLTLMNVEGFLKKLHNIHQGDQQKWVFAEAFHVLEEIKERRVTLEDLEKAVQWAIEQETTYQKLRKTFKGQLSMKDILLPSALSMRTDIPHFL